ncbi:MAG: histidine kinase dimerization/phospho-acceptor domain-containing protein, partial [Spirochaetales bacterium]|nr:histidine kinase dimerization/phospho-acceptor domain-containing protein [Spirochaetales bacterium]
MLKNQLTIQKKLLAGFIGILVLAGFAGITGVRGISEINHQNRIGKMVEELIESTERAQASSLRYIIYEDEGYHTEALEYCETVLTLAEEIEPLMHSQENIARLRKLISYMEDYRLLILNFKDLEAEKTDSQVTRQSVGLEMIDMSNSLISVLNEDLDTVDSRSRGILQSTISGLQQILASMNNFRSSALNYSALKDDSDRNRAAEIWLEELDRLEMALRDLAASSEGRIPDLTLTEIVTALRSYKAEVVLYHQTTSDLWQEQHKQRDAAAMVIDQVSAVSSGVQTSITIATLNAKRAIWISLTIAVIFSIFIAMVLSRNITHPLQQGIKVARNIAAGKMDNTALNLTRQDELGDLAAALDTMTHSLQIQHWLQEGKEGLDDEMRGDHDLKELTSRFIKFTARHMEASLGAFYLFDGRETLELLSSYSFTDRDGNYNKIRPGEGFIGQAALEKEILYFSGLKDAPELNFGAGSAAPPYYMAASLKFKDELIGVFILGSFKEFDEERREFITSNIENAAILFNAAKSRDTISRLLESSQQQQEELKKINEELEDQTNALRESEAELQAQQEELRVTNEELEERTQAVEEQRDSIRVKNDELVRAQEDIKKKAEDLEQASRYKSEFLANMSHELRTPLNSILILAQLLSQNGDGNLTEKQVKSASAIHASGSDLLKLINEILDLSKVEAGKVELHFETISFTNIMEDLTRVFTDTAAEKKLKLEIEAAEGLAPSIKTDTHRLQQIIRNLMTNALKFTDKGSVSLEIVHPSGPWRKYRKGEYVEFRVKDTGIGIPEEKQASIFEAFKQADGSTI